MPTNTNEHAIVNRILKAERLARILTEQGVEFRDELDGWGEAEWDLLERIDATAHGRKHRPLSPATKAATLALIPIRPAPVEDVDALFASLR